MSESGIDLAFDITDHLLGDEDILLSQSGPFYEIQSKPIIGRLVKMLEHLSWSWEFAPSCKHHLFQAAWVICISVTWKLQKHHCLFIRFFTNFPIYGYYMKFKSYRSIISERNILFVYPPPGIHLAKLQTETDLTFREGCKIHSLTGRRDLTLKIDMAIYGK